MTSGASGASDLIDIFGRIKVETDKAVLFRDGTKDVWLPLSQIEVEEEPHGHCTVTMPEWLAQEKGLI